VRADLILFLEDALRLLGAIPEILAAGLFEKLVLAGGQRGDVKDASRVCRRAVRIPRAAVEDR
jgi:hypothetical protein